MNDSTQQNMNLVEIFQRQRHLNRKIFPMLELSSSFMNKASVMTEKKDSYMPRFLS